MKTFDKWAEYYDIYYADKNYKIEVDFLLSLASKYGQGNPKSILDIGCGTGGHLIFLCKKGIKVKGFDLSEKMIKLAKQKIAKAGFGANAKVDVGNAVSYRCRKKYDLVISMFSVMGYLTSNEEFLAGLKTARVHLNERGLFIFDVWFGPAVLNNLPETRIQEFTIKGLKTFRLVRPKLDVLHQVVIIDYDILTFDGKMLAKKVRERHRMRYFFAQELKFILENAGFCLLKICPFLNSSINPSIDDWNISVVAKATKHLK